MRAGVERCFLICTNVERPLSDAASIAKLPEGCCLYTLRHSFITEAISQGLTTLDAARLCGTSVLMIEKHSGRLVTEYSRIFCRKSDDLPRTWPS